MLRSAYHLAMTINTRPIFLDRMDYPRRTVSRRSSTSSARPTSRWCDACAKSITIPNWARHISCSESHLEAVELLTGQRPDRVHPVELRRQRSSSSSRYDRGHSRQRSSFSRLDDPHSRESRSPSPVRSSQAPRNGALHATPRHDSYVLPPTSSPIAARTGISRQDLRRLMVAVIAVGDSDFEGYLDVARRIAPWAPPVCHEMAATAADMLAPSFWVRSPSVNDRATVSRPPNFVNSVREISPPMEFADEQPHSSRPPVEEFPVMTPVTKSSVYARPASLNRRYVPVPPPSTVVVTNPTRPTNTLVAPSNATARDEASRPEESVAPQRDDVVGTEESLEDPEPRPESGDHHSVTITSVLDPRSNVTLAQFEAINNLDDRIQAMCDSELPLLIHLTPDLALSPPPAKRSKVRTESNYPKKKTSEDSVIVTSSLPQSKSVTEANTQSSVREKYPKIRGVVVRSIGTSVRNDHPTTIKSVIAKTDMGVAVSTTSVHRPLMSLLDLNVQPPSSIRKSVTKGDHNTRSNK